MIHKLSLAALAGIAVSIALILQPWWVGGFRVGFFATAGFTVLHIVAAHLNKSEAQ